MAENEQPAQGSLASTFPGPPVFWKDFTPENLERVEALRKAHAEAEGDAVGPATRIPGVPEELVNLQPPAPPADGQWRVFGDLYKLEDELPSLEDQGITDLAPKDGTEDDKALQLKRMAKSLLLNFFELTDIMATNVSQAEPKLNDIRTLFINTHHTINEWRPHQAREALIAMLQGRIDRVRNDTKLVREATERTRRTLESLADIEVPPDPTGRATAPFEDTPLEGERRRQAIEQRQAEIWDAMDEAAFA
ncbi:uncharacterized protein E0L32_005861 [Thyridium curvatum]|uniref:Mediator of RNA polymerase II transcription subunit 7 n=1 Tax=Thyridium curvatum TaxID=1093900 RepID=A0A507BA50_9PEZI|nr:uncharacterized protein E0L32_005861 [Thyridium curvatum]TPX13658.1 hypothetical protein E0L32_005861 [Thyridium curvatum]